MLWHILHIHNKRAFMVVLALFQYYDFQEHRDYYNGTVHLGMWNDTRIIYRLTGVIPPRDIRHEENMYKELQQIRNMDIIIKPYYPILYLPFY